MEENTNKNCINCKFYTATDSLYANTCRLKLGGYEQMNCKYFEEDNPYIYWS